jgi:hypothetical protein
MTLDTALNLVWLAIGAVALCLLAFLETRRYRHSTRRARWVRLVAVLVLTVALFPTVSSSDDLFSFALLDSHLGKHGGAGSTPPEDSKEKAGMLLYRVLETLDHYQISNIYTLSLAVSCLGFVFALYREVATRAVTSRPGRAPPTSSTFITL